MEEGNTLIPGLPNDLAICCLIPVPRIYHLSMRAVNCQWRSLLLNPFSQFHTERKRQALTNPSLFLLASSCHSNRVECTEIDLLSHKKSKTTFTNDSVRESIFPHSHACISHGALVIVLGGYRNNEFPFRGGQFRGQLHIASKSVHIFNTITKKWTLGADMCVPRGKFAWGLIGNRLYVAGGIGGDKMRNLVTAEVYDFEANEWSMVSSMPVSMTIDVFFVFSGKLFVRGWLRENAVEAYSYCPLTNVWEEDNWLLRVLEPVPAVTSNKFAKFAVPGDENGIYMVEKSEPFVVAWSKTNRLSISRLDNETLKWVRVYQILDKARPVSCVCSYASTGDVPFYGLKDGVVVLCHQSESENESDNAHREVEVSSVYDGIVKVSVRCPCKWSASCAVVNA